MQPGNKKKSLEFGRNLVFTSNLQVSHTMVQPNHSGAVPIRKAAIKVHKVMFPGFH